MIYLFHIVKCISILLGYRHDKKCSKTNTEILVQKIVVNSGLDPNSSGQVCKRGLIFAGTKPVRVAKCIYT